MKITIETQAKHIEVVNFALGIVLKQFELDPQSTKDYYSLSPKDVAGARVLQKKLVNTLLQKDAALKKTQPQSKESTF